MGKNKIDVCAKIDDHHKRTVTYSKRKRGILKKLIELSTMCDQHISLTIFNKDN